MARNVNWQEEEEQGAAAASTEKQGTSGTIGGMTEADPAAASGSAPAPAPSNQGTGSGFVNLQAYMDANKNEGGRMVNDATQGLVKEANSFGDSASKIVQDQQKAMASSVGSVSGLRDGLRTNAAANKDAAAAYLGAGYQGPTADVAGAGVMAQQKALSEKLGATNSDTVAEALKANTKAPYSSGFGILDKFLMGDQSGQQAMQAVKSKTADVDAAGAAALQQLGASEQAARAELDRNKSQLLKTAKATMGNITEGAQAKAAEANKAINTEFEGTRAANIGYGLDDKGRADLEALAALQGQGSDAAWYDSVYNLGRAKVAPTPPPVEVGPGVVEGQPSGQKQLADVAGLTPVVDAGKALMKTPSLNSLGKFGRSILDVPAKPAKKHVIDPVVKFEKEKVAPALQQVAKAVTAAPAIKVSAPKLSKPKKPKW